MLPLQPFSGAPGYLSGFPLLAGLATADPNAAAAANTANPRIAVARFRQGLLLPGAGPSGRCPSSLATGEAIVFGYNSSSSCSLGLTLAEVS
jgi:hypothetical protein